MPTSKAPVKAGNPGSPSAGEPVYLAVGILRRTHGVHGDILLDVTTDFPERLSPGTQIYVGDKKKAIKITRRRPHNDGLILGFEGISDPDQAAKFRAQMVFVRAENRPELPAGEYYHHQIIGLNVVDEFGAALGVISEIIETGANDVYVVRTTDDKEILLPAIKQVLLGVDLAMNTMRVHLLPGLVDGLDEA